MLVQISSFVVMEATDHTAAFQVFLDASGLMLFRQWKLTSSKSRYRTYDLGTYDMG